jgi:hypothetical protein
VVSGALRVCGRWNFLVLLKLLPWLELEEGEDGKRSCVNKRASPPDIVDPIAVIVGCFCIGRVVVLLLFLVVVAGGRR